MMLVGTDPLTRFLNGVTRREFHWGNLDCLTWLGEWIKESRGFDPAIRWRGRYHNLLGAARIVKDAGGMVRLVDFALRNTGIERVTKFQRGDIAVVPVAGKGVEPFGSVAGSILLEGTAALLCQDGLLLNRIDDAPPLAIWRI